VKAHEMLETISPTAARSLQVVLPAHAAEPADVPGNAARPGEASRAAVKGDKLNALLPGGGSDALTFSNTNVFTKKSLFVRCSSPATEKLVAERRAAREGAGGAPLMARGRSDLANGSPTVDCASSS